MIQESQAEKLGVCQIYIRTELPALDVLKMFRKAIRSDTMSLQAQRGDPQSHI
jgi:hypothetical protein